MAIAKQYSPKDVEQRVYAAWEAAGAFNAEPDDGGEPFCIVIPPPNVTGALHLGHAINNSLQDALIRYHRMRGDNTLWVPGIDHAGIATQAVVEKRLLELEGQTRHDVGREGLVARIWEWKATYAERILDQLRSLGCSCDWRRTRFTLDEQCARAVRHTFYRMFTDGLIYRGKRLVNWDAHLQTAVSDDEVYHETVKGSLWYYWYPVVDSDERLLIATTRPETMLGDTAVAVHPEDERYRHLVGKQVALPLTERRIPIIADAELVDPTFGTGCVKVTPAHDPNDYECGLRQGLEMINILNADGSINANGGRFEGMERYTARKAVVAALEYAGLLEKIEPYETPIGHSDRSKTPIEPYLSDQWFVRMAELAQAAMDVVTDGRVAFHPPRYAKMYLDWLSEKRDWPISRQLWWGHRIPIWYAQGCSEEDLAAAFAGRDDVAWRWDEEYGQWLISSQEEDLPSDAVPGCELVQDPDVLDTWFSSALWPHSTLGWPEQTAALKCWYPTSVLVTSRDIITLWVARMVMTGLFNTGEIPFSDVPIHVKILDGQGQTMSKSKGNGVDPLDIIAQYGADALRFTMLHMSTETQDVRVPVLYKCPHCGELTPQTPQNMTATTLPCSRCKQTMATRWAADELQEEHGLAFLTSERFEIGRNFCNKIWNASRFVMMNLEQGVPVLTPQALYARFADGGEGAAGLSSDDAWILERLAQAVRETTAALDGFHFHECARGLYDFFWNDFCDWYVEAAKTDLYGDDAEAKQRVQAVLTCVLNTAVRLLHPVMPHLSEEIWTLLHEATDAPCETMLIRAPWPVPQTGFCSAERMQQVRRKYELIGLGRSLRSEFNIAPATPARFAIKPHSTATAEFLAQERETMARFMQASAIELDENFEPAQPLPSEIADDATIYMYLDGAIDMAAEAERIGRQIKEVERYLASLDKKLANEKFVNNAPAEVVEKERAKRAEAAERQAKLRATYEFVSGTTAAGA